MIRTDASFARDVEDAVRSAESGTAAEIVVVVARRSGSYRDVAIASGAAFAWAILVAVLFVEAEFHPVWIAAEVPLAGAAAAWLVHRTPSLLKRLTSPSRRMRQTREAAHAVFHEEAVHGTKGRTGLLVYLSLLEERVEVIPDAGLEALIPGADWHAIRWDAADSAGFVAGLRAVGAVLGKRLPAAAGDANELPDAPRFLP